MVARFDLEQPVQRPKQENVLGYWKDEERDGSEAKLKDTSKIANKAQDIKDLPCM